MNDLIITSTSFANNTSIPKKHTGYGEDISPAFNIDCIGDNVVSLAIIMDDLDIPFLGALNHWLIWNIPKTNYIAENIPYGPNPKSEFGNAVQGMAWGKKRYRGPKQPIFIHKAHRYSFQFYALDTFIDLDSSNGKNDLLKAMQGHILKTGSIVGIYKR